MHLSCCFRRYGIVDGRIVFEGGSRCGKGEGVHVLVPDPAQMQLIIDSLDMSSKGQLARGPSRRFGNGENISIFVRMRK